MTNGAQVSREMQLRALVADQNGGDSLTLNFLTIPPVILTISPLKRLQSTQSNDFSQNTMFLHLLSMKMLPETRSSLSQ